MERTQWTDAVRFCNRCSELEGLTPCYDLARWECRFDADGYRLPTEAEWEVACRAGAVTARYYGRGRELLPRYGWFVKPVSERAWPVGSLRPNDLGLFDALGNVAEWSENSELVYETGQTEDVENRDFLLIDERSVRILRGGSFAYRPESLRCANRNTLQPGKGVIIIRFGYPLPYFFKIILGFLTVVTSPDHVKKSFH